MTDQEKYIAGQEASGIEIGDEVRATRQFDGCEGGHAAGASHSWRHKVNFIDAGATGTVTRVKHNYIEVACGMEFGGLWNFPYFVLEIVKKANGTKPIETLTGDSNMSVQEQTVSQVTIIERTEVLHEGSGVVQKINREILFDKKVSAVSDEAKKQKALDVCRKAKEKAQMQLDCDKLEITCKPF